MRSGTVATGRPERRSGATLSAQALLQLGVAAGISVWTWDSASDIVHQVANRGGGRPAQAGVPFEETLSGIHPEDRARVRRTMRRAMRSGATGSFRFRLQPTAGGKVRHFNATHYQLRPGELKVIVQEITRAVDAESALRESEDHYRTAIDLNSEVMWLADPQGNIIEFGRRWLDMVGITHEQTMGQGWVAAIHPDDLPETVAKWTHAVETGEPVDVEFRIRLKDGSFRWMRSRAAPRRDAEGRIVRWYGTLGDIHDRKLAEAALRDSEAFARSILEASDMAIEVLDLEGRLIFMNGPGIQIMEVEDFERIRGRPFESFWPADAQSAVRGALAAARAGETVRRTLFGPTSKGTPRWWDMSISPIHVDGRIVRLLALSRDVTEGRRTEDEVEAGARRLADVLESTMDSVISVDQDWKITYLNRHALQSFPAGSGSLIGRDLRDIFDPVDAGPFFRRYETAMAEQRSISFEQYLASADAWYEVQAYGSPAGLTVFFRDVTERHNAQERVAYLARHDGLTGLLNRMQFQEAFDAALAELQPGQMLAVLSIDLDDFKLVNDTLGHPAGDALLQEAAARLRQAIGPHDLAARLGGDEFTALLRIERREDAAKAAQAILAALGGPFVFEGQSISTGASVGIALAPQDGRASEALLAFADVALYRVKHEKGRAYRFFEPAMDLALRERRQMKRELGQALERGELSLVFQPQVDIASHRLDGFEALLRWNHPTRGQISPTIFVPLAEESGLIDKIGRFVLELGCAEALTWPPGISLAVNLSPMQFRGQSVVGTVAEALRLTGLPPERLELEITESVLLEESTDSISALEAFHRMGIRVALDDFGTGYSSLSYLRRFPFDKIKIDRSFIADLPQSEGSTAIVRAIVGLSRSLKARVTAEGVESREQLQALKAEGCDEAQGYLFSPPLPPNQARALAARGLTLVGPGRTPRAPRLGPVKRTG